MSIEVFPAPSTAAGPDAKVFQIAAAYTTYEINDTFSGGGYTVTTSPSNQQVQVQFVNASSVLADYTTVSGTVSFSVASDATQVYIKDTSGATNTTVTITYTSSNASGAALSGTLDTVTTSSTYNTTGLLYVLTIGGAGGGGGGGNNDGGGGGGSGGYAGQLFYTNTATSITVGAGGNGGVWLSDPTTHGGATSFGNLLTVNGGNGGRVGTVGGGGGSGGTPGGVDGGRGGQANFNAGNGNATVGNFQSIKSGTNGSGGGGRGASNSVSPGIGGGSGIGTGGTGSTNNAGTAPSGYGAGGGGGGQGQGANASGAGHAGTAGVVYVLRGF